MSHTKAEFCVLLEMRVQDPLFMVDPQATSSEFTVRLIDGPRPAGMGWERLAVNVDGEAWVPWTPNAMACARIALQLHRSLSQEAANREVETKKLRQLLQNEKEAAARETRRNLGMAEEVESLRDQVATLEAALGAEDDGDLPLALRSLVAEVEEVVQLLTIVEGWPDLGFLRYARADLTAALHHAKAFV